jgi:hypothetical protein
VIRLLNELFLCKLDRSYFIVPESDGFDGESIWWRGGLGFISDLASPWKSPRMKVLIIARKANIHSVTGPDVPVNFKLANSKDKSRPVTISSVNTIAKAVTDENETAPNKAKLGWIGELQYIRQPIITEVPIKIQPKVNDTTPISHFGTGGRCFVS